MAYLEKVGELKFANIINSVDVPVVTGLRTVLAGQGVLEVGTALAVNAAGKLVVLGTEGGTANCILCEAVDTTAGDALGFVALSGKFNRNALSVKAEYTITEKDVEAFRAAGIFLENAVI